MLPSQKNYDVTRAEIKNLDKLSHIEQTLLIEKVAMAITVMLKTGFRHFGAN